MQHHGGHGKACGDAGVLHRCGGVDEPLHDAAVASRVERPGANIRWCSKPWQRQEPLLGLSHHRLLQHRLQVVLDHERVHHLACKGERRLVNGLENGCKTIPELRNKTGVQNTASILQKNFYGWFSRLDRGVYELSPTGIQSSKEYAHIIHGLINPYK